MFWPSLFYLAMSCLLPSLERHREALAANRSANGQFIFNRFRGLGCINYAQRWPEHTNIDPGGWFWFGWHWGVQREKRLDGWCRKTESVNIVKTERREQTDTRAKVSADQCPAIQCVYLFSRPACLKCKWGHKGFSHLDNKWSSGWQCSNVNDLIITCWIGYSHIQRRLISVNVRQILLISTPRLILDLIVNSSHAVPIVGLTLPPLWLISMWEASSILS